VYPLSPPPARSYTRRRSSRCDTSTAQKKSACRCEPVVPIQRTSRAQNKPPPAASPIRPSRRTRPRTRAHKAIRVTRSCETRNRLVSRALYSKGTRTPRATTPRDYPTRTILSDPSASSIYRAIASLFSRCTFTAIPTTRIGSH